MTSVESMPTIVEPACNVGNTISFARGLSIVASLDVLDRTWKNVTELEDPRHWRVPAPSKSIPTNTQVELYTSHEGRELQLSGQAALLTPEDRRSITNEVIAKRRESGMIVRMTGFTAVRYVGADHDFIDVEGELSDDDGANEILYDDQDAVADVLERRFGLAADSLELAVPSLSLARIATNQEAAVQEIPTLIEKLSERVGEYPIVLGDIRRARKLKRIHWASYIDTRHKQGRGRPLARYALSHGAMDKGFLNSMHPYRPGGSV